MKKTLLCLLYFFGSYVFSQNTDNTWRYIYVRAGYVDVRPLTTLVEKNKITVSGRDSFEIIIAKDSTQITGFLLNNGNKEVLMPTTPSGQIKAIMTVILKNGEWKAFQHTKNDGISCGHGTPPIQLPPKNGLPFKLTPLTSGEVKTKMKVLLYIEDKPYYSNEVDITLTTNQYNAIFAAPTNPQNIQYSFPETPKLKRK